MLVNQQNVVPLITCSRITVYTTISTSIHLHTMLLCLMSEGRPKCGRREEAGGKQKLIQPETHSTLTKLNQRQGTKTRELNSTLTNTTGTTETMHAAGWRGKHSGSQSGVTRKGNEHDMHETGEWNRKWILRHRKHRDPHTGKKHMRKNQNINRTK